MEQDHENEQTHLHGVVQNIDDEYVLVKMLPSSGSLEIDIPLSLCPEDVQYEGMAVEVVLCPNDGITSLSINKRTPASLPGEISETMNSVLKWAESL